MLSIIHANKQLSLLLPFLSHNGSAAVNGSVAGKLVLSPVAEFCNHSVAWGLVDWNTSTVCRLTPGSRGNFCCRLLSVVDPTSHTRPLGRLRLRLLSLTDQVYLQLLVTMNTCHQPLYLPVCSRYTSLRGDWSHSFPNSVEEPQSDDPDTPIHASPPVKAWTQAYLSVFTGDNLWIAALGHDGTNLR